MGIEFGDVNFVLNKLKKDGYVEESRMSSTEQERIAISYYINFDGLVFNEQGGYMAVKKEQERLSILEAHQRRQSKITLRLTWIIAVGTAIAAVYYFLEVVKLCGRQ